MKRINFNIKDRKILTLGLCLILVCVFTLSIAYAALNAVLTIQGNTEVVGSNWDIHLENPIVKSGSATTDVPVITSGKSLTFNTTLNMPGDFYEFTVDVVNNGSIDAMIDKVTKTPELTIEQAKYLKYEVSYANLESIDTKQTIIAGATMPLRVRVEYRKDLIGTDLPSEQVVLNLSLVLDYIQSDGSGSEVYNNGVKIISANGNISRMGTLVTIGTEQFYTIGIEENNVKLLSKMNVTLEENSIQSEEAGVTNFSDDNTHGENYSDYSGSLVEKYTNYYKNTIESFHINVEEARAITKDEYGFLKIYTCNQNCNDKGCTDLVCEDDYFDWAISTDYWTGSANTDIDIWCAGADELVSFEYESSFGVRPVIVISKDYF